MCSCGVRTGSARALCSQSSVNAVKAIHSSSTYAKPNCPLRCIGSACCLLLFSVKVRYFVLPYLDGIWLILKNYPLVGVDQSLCTATFLCAHIFSLFLFKL